MTRIITQSLITNLFEDFDQIYNTRIISTRDNFWNKVIVAKNLHERKLVGKIKYYRWPQEAAYQLWFQIENKFYTSWYYYHMGEIAQWVLQEIDEEKFNNPFYEN